ncbi:MAG: putative molybdenum carrier protein [Desulfobulbaceae bacterium]
MKIISGGQTGADRAALDAAIELGIPHGGWLPRGRKTEDGPLPGRYRLREMRSPRYRDRTEKNIRESDGTLIVSFGPLTGGSALTEALALKHDRPCLVIDLELVPAAEAVTALERWLRKHRIAILNVAGPRASGEPRIYDAVRDLLLAVDWRKFTG